MPPGPSGVERRVSSSRSGVRGWKTDAESLRTYEPSRSTTRCTRPPAVAQGDRPVGADRHDDRDGARPARHGVEVAHQRHGPGPGRVDADVGGRRGADGRDVEDGRGGAGRQRARADDPDLAHLAGPQGTDREAGVEQAGGHPAGQRRAGAGREVAGEVGDEVHPPGGVAQADAAAVADLHGDEVGHGRAGDDVEVADDGRRGVAGRCGVDADVGGGGRRGGRHAEHHGGRVLRHPPAVRDEQVAGLPRPDRTRPTADARARVEQPHRVQRDVPRLARGRRGSGRGRACHGQEHGDQEERQESSEARHARTVLRSRPLVGEPFARPGRQGVRREGAPWLSTRSRPAGCAR